MAAAGGRSLEETSTWAVSVLCLFFLLISVSIEGGLHKLTKFLNKRKRKSLRKALAKTKAEMMKFGFLSFLLTILGVPISKICIGKAVANSFLPCEDPLELAQPAIPPAAEVSASKSDQTLSTEEVPDELKFCEAKGMVPLVSSEGIMQLSVFISVLAVFHIMYCILTMCLGMAKMRKWKNWENETRTLEYQIAKDSRRFQLTVQTSVGKRHLKFWSNYTLLLWMVCFVRQFYASVSKSDYFTLRNGFIVANMSVGSNFNFQKFLRRAHDEDFEKVVGIRFWIWIFSIIFILLTAHKFYNHYWLPFIPLVISLIVGTKLQVIITKMCVESCKENPVVKGTLLVKPNDHYFWFGRPDWLLHLIQFILIQNSFQLAFFTWTWYEYGLSSCFNREKEEMAIRISMGLAVQFLCGYVTLPLYVLVTQMGSGMRKAVFTERVVAGLKNWHRQEKQSLSKDDSSLFTEQVVKGPKNWQKNAKKSLSTRNYSTSSRHNSTSNTSVSCSGETMHLPEDEVLPPLMVSRPLCASTSGTKGEQQQSVQNHNRKLSGHSTIEITNVEEENSKIIPRGNYDGEISFRSSWKAMLSSREIREINSIIEEDDS
ncbi:hypothetical protein L6164_022397 [Bauhinia variegata]|uniref:Uncharacterized protein n=1 Tax=Bauhinia variegata TaxID=167791 RepID=A0ACB9MIE4_BAUVA|nr:hypothetical protein L6164_022397 [Bauhinia variegata]